MIILPPGEAERLGQLDLSGLEKDILRRKQDSPVQYYHVSARTLEFELKTRSLIVEAARGLYQSRAAFATFENSRCNSAFWIREPNGGFRIRGDATPAEGIRDIYRNGTLYAFECATAMTIVLYKAVLDAIGDPAFNAYFSGLVLYDWQHDSDLRIITVGLNQASHGDVLYFNNPDFNPSTPWWRGENAIMMPDGHHYAHGMGMKTADEIIGQLNARRKPGSRVSAYLTNDAETLDFDYIQSLRPIVGRIGSVVFHARAGERDDKPKNPGSWNF
ncbi:protein-glutamine gamma-glutamyltransferase [Paenibacillus sp. DYY-L-2]|uniref:protein-glutamine gamma-glutamyltransferase n=1 Tax=Paenibacillus sp. DYY-L-2 TaxID=3447013 RepID=UPI003F4FA672